MTETTTLTNQAAEIRRHHDAVHAAARTAIEHALAAGRLLAEVKAALPHGDFEGWLAANCQFSARTARRYMQLDSHRDSLPAGAGVKAALEHLKTDTVSEMETPRIPPWFPPVGEAVIHGYLWDSFWIVWPADTEYANAMAFLVDRRADGTTYCRTKRPVRSDWITPQIRSMDLPDPNNAVWRSIPIELARKLDDLARALESAAEHGEEAAAA